MNLVNVLAQFAMKFLGAQYFTPASWRLESGKSWVGIPSGSQPTFHPATFHAVVPCQIDYLE